MKRSSCLPSTLLAAWVLLGLAARVFVPAGFMPGPIADGWPVVSCPGQSHGTRLANGPLADGQKGHEGHEDDCDADCYQGLFFALAAEVDAVDVAPVDLPETERLLVVDVASAAPHSADSPRPRGPPTSTSDVA
jgi:hypothetical protein